LRQFRFRDLLEQPANGAFRHSPSLPKPPLYLQQSTPLTISE
jgi:hypothetical protein